MGSKSYNIVIQKPVEDNSIALFLVRCRVRNYFLLMKSFLMQYKQGLILLLALLTPTIAGLNYIFTKPFLVFITAHHPMNALMSAFLIYFIYVIWIVIQKPAIQSHTAESYFATLPISKKSHRMIDLLMLFIANNIFLIPLMAAVAQITFSNPCRLDYFLSVIFLTLSIFSIEKNALYKNSLGCLWVIIANVIYCFAKPFLSDILFSAVSMFFIISFFYTLLWDVRIKSKSIQLLSMDYHPLSLRSALLLRTAKTQSISRLCLTAFTYVLGFLLLFFSKLSLYPLEMILVVQGITAFIASGIFVYFEKEKRKYESYLKSLPVSKTDWMLKDISYVVFVLILLNVSFFFMITYHFSIGFSWIFAIEPYQIILLILLYQIRTRFDVFGTLLSSVTTVAWIYFSILLKGFL